MSNRILRNGIELFYQQPGKRKIAPRRARRDAATNFYDK